MSSKTGWRYRQGKRNLEWYCDHYLTVIYRHARMSCVQGLILNRSYSILVDSPAGQRKRVFFDTLREAIHAVETGEWEGTP